MVQGVTLFYKRRRTMENCTSCGRSIPFKEAKENAEGLLEEIKRPLDEGPICGICARKIRF